MSVPFWGPVWGEGRGQVETASDFLLSPSSESAQASTSTITCDLAQKAVGKQQPSGQPGKTNCRPPS